MPTSTDDTTLPAASILLVDDEPSVLSALRRLLRPHGYRLQQATSGAEALALLREAPVDLIISDMRMPGMDGAQFLEASREPAPEAVRILLTGYADISSTVQAINRGELHRYIQKPWDDQDILLIVRQALERQGLERRNRQLSAENARRNEELRQLNASLEARVKARTAEIEQINDMLEKAYEELNENFKLAVNLFSGLMEAREGGMAGHGRRVADLSRRVAIKLGLSERDREDVYLAALLHDLGKMGFPDGMLRRPVSVYNPEELARYRKHPLDGEAALMPLAKMHGVARMVRQHHERYDGKGFPDGVVGDEIVLGARIIAAASDYDGMVTGSLTENAYGPDAAMQSLRGSAGTRYDPRVVEALEQALAEQAREINTDRKVDVRELQPGMVLARDLLSSKGAILLAAGYVFEPRVIRQVNEFAQREGLRLSLFIRAESSTPHFVRPALPAVATS
ncbi:response regulator [Ideonella sp. 4Y16]|uniref:Response regulator n=1 Tax=Ideonella alba TaxID=2824118 RepID=A0A941BLP1_9BURK|nr:HD domain-containing phosphohydrolase [Ideonella alba]MBQ0931399.1 response regulator [Ideonella alba]MBQ0945013.1 response regulator [Ideonella alba]